MSKTITIKKNDYVGDGKFVKILPGTRDYSGLVALVEVNMYYTFYNIDTKYNNDEVTLGPLNSETVIKIRPGSYSIIMLDEFIRLQYKVKTGNAIDTALFEGAETYNRVRIIVPGGWVLKFNKGMADFLGANPTEGDHYIFRGLALEPQEFLLPKIPQTEQVVNIRFKLDIIRDASEGQELYSFTPALGFPALLSVQPPVPSYFEVVEGETLRRIELTVMDQLGRLLDIEDYFSLKLHFIKS